MLFVACHSRFDTASAVSRFGMTKVGNDHLHKSIQIRYCRYCIIFSLWFAASPKGSNQIRTATGSNTVQFLAQWACHVPLKAEISNLCIRSYAANWLSFNFANLQSIWFYWFWCLFRVLSKLLKFGTVRMQYPMNVVKVSDFLKTPGSSRGGWGDGWTWIGKDTLPSHVQP